MILNLILLGIIGYKNWSTLVEYYKYILDYSKKTFEKELGKDWTSNITNVLLLMVFGAVVASISIWLIDTILMTVLLAVYFVFDYLSSKDESKK